MQTFGKLSVSSRRVNAYVTGLATSASARGTLPPYNGIGAQFVSSSKAAAAPNTERGFEQMQVNTTGHVDIVVANGAYATFRGGYFHDRYSDTGIPKITSWTYQTVAPAVLDDGTTLPANIPGPQFHVNTPRAQITNFDTTTRRTFNADYNHTFQRAGWHTLKGGAGYQHIENDVDSLYPGGYVLIFWDRSTGLTGQAPDRGTYGHYEVNTFGTIGKAGANMVSLYLQDQWQIGDRLTLNLGVRTEDERVPTFRPDILADAMKFGFADKLAPRVGVAFDVTGNGSAKVYASYGRYFDWTKYEIARGSFGGDIWCVKYRAIDNPSDPLTATYDDAPGRDLWRIPGGCRDRRANSINNVDPDLKPMSQDSYSAGIDFVVDPRTVAAVRYVHNNLIRTVEDLAGLVNGDEVYVIGNPGEGLTETTLASGSPLTGTFPTPKPKRQYDAVEFGISRRFANNWFGSANLTISRLYGNYAGLASSDEIRTPTTGVGGGGGSAAGGQHLPAGRQREPRLGPRRLDVRLARQSRRTRPPRHRSSGRGRNSTARTRWPATRRSARLCMPAAERR